MKSTNWSTQLMLGRRSSTSKTEASIPAATIIQAWRAQVTLNVSSTTATTLTWAFPLSLPWLTSSTQARSSKPDSSSPTPISTWGGLLLKSEHSLELPTPKLCLATSMWDTGISSTYSGPCPALIQEMLDLRTGRWVLIWAQRREIGGRRQHGVLQGRALGG